MRLMVIDGNSIVNRAFFGISQLNAPDGTPTNGVYGFLTIYRRLIGDVEPDAVCVTFDVHAPTFRHIQYEGYKAQRKGMPEELVVQMPILKDVLDAMNVRRYEKAGWEADDLIGTIARLSGEKGWETVIVTGDRDSFQLIGPGSAVYHVKSRMGQTEYKIYDEAAFREEYGFEPIRIVDLKALMGDASDNIPGVAGVGEKTAMDLIRRFGTVDAIYSGLDGLDVKDSVRKKLAAGEESARMSFDLATIRRDAPIEFAPEDCLVKSPDNDALYELFRRLGFRKLIDSFSLTAPAVEKAAAEKREFTGTVSLIEEPDRETLRAHTAGRLCAVRFNGDMTRAYITTDDDSTDSVGFTLALGHSEAAEWFFSGEVRKAGHDIKDSMRELLRLGLGIEGWEFDSALAAYLLNPTASGYELGRLCEDYCGFTLPDGADGNGQLSLLADETKDLARLMSESAGVLCLRDELLPRLEKDGMAELLRDIELPLCPVLAKMEAAGFLVDRKALHDFGVMLTGEVDRLTAEIYDLAGEEFNINSPKQLGVILFDKLMLPAPKKTKTGYSTNADVLEKLRRKHPIVGKILEYRELAKLKSTYAEGLEKVIGDDGRIHTNFQMTVTATGRLSSTEPNLQNIPVRKELGGEIRKMFVPAPGCVLVDADYSQIELRILAHMAKDEAMIRAFTSGEDIHRATAAQVLGIDPAEVSHAERSKAKAVNFGIVYGISAFSLSEDIGVSVAEARAYINAYMARYSGVADYMDRTVKEARETGAAVTLYGRRRPLPELTSSNFNLRSFGERVARNMPIQGTAADIMKKAMINVDRALTESGLDAKILLQVHDELIIECPEAQKEEVAALLTREMEGAAQLTVPLTVEAKWGSTWYEAK